MTVCVYTTQGFPGGSDSKESACNAGDPDFIPGSGRSPGKGNGNPLQYSCLENYMDRGAWWTTVHGVRESDMTARLIHKLEFIRKNFRGVKDLKGKNSIFQLLKSTQHKISKYLR